MNHRIQPLRTQFNAILGAPAWILGNHQPGGYPNSSLDGLFQGKSHENGYKWMMTGGSLMTQESYKAPFWGTGIRESGCLKLLTFVENLHALETLCPEQTPTTPG